MKNNNITLDFTVSQTINSLTKDQALALMPANLAKRALKALAHQMQRSSLDEIIDDYTRDLKNTNSLDKAITVSISFVEERSLIQNITHEK